MKSKLYLIMFLSIFLISLVSASYLPHKQNTNLEFSITSNFADECTLTTINTPNGVVTIDQTDTSSGTFSFNVLGGNYSQLGTYCHNIVCTDGTDTTSGQECRKITSGGDDFDISQSIILLGLLGIIGLLFGISLTFKEKKWKLKSFFHMGALFFGIILLNSIRILIGTSGNLASMGEIGLIIGIVIISFMIMYIFILYTIEVIRYFKKKNRNKWEIGDDYA